MIRPGDRVRILRSSPLTVGGLCGIVWNIRDGLIYVQPDGMVEREPFDENELELLESENDAF